MMSKERNVFKAIADPTRRQIIEMLSKETLTVNGIAEHFKDISRPAVSKHVKILTEADLVHIYQQGRERFCHIHAAPLREISDWIRPYERFWDSKLDELGDYLDQKYGEE